MKHVATRHSTKAVNPTEGRWVGGEGAGALQRIEDLDGISWADAPVPPRLHRCKAQTQGLLSSGWVYRCACGAISSDGRWGSRRNSRRR